MLRCELAAAPASDPGVLGCVAFDAATAPDPRAAAVALRPLAGPPVEIWRGGAPVRRGDDRDFGWAEDGELLFARTVFDPDVGGDFAPAAESTYRRIAAFAAARGYPHLLRCWNYFDEIHRGAGDDERYRRFCVGRHAALTAPGFEQRLPAATVIGTPAGVAGQVIFIAAREPGVQVENPRQVPAFRYPREYSPRAPSFSRAMRQRAAGGDRLFVSGTASVVGHATRHPGDALAQLSEIRANLDALLQAAGGAWQARALKVYLRDAALLAPVRAEFARLFGAAAPALFLQGDICRTDLAVEVEGYYEASAEA